jgi:hypothetical protein
MHGKSFARSVIAAVLLAAPGCIGEVGGVGDGLDEIDTAELDEAPGALQALDREFRATPGATRQAASLRSAICDGLRPIYEAGVEAQKMGFVYGAAAEGGAGLQGARGYDVVWDLYHHQVTVSEWTGGGVGTLVGADVEAYVGMAFGFQHGVSDWDGWFANVELTASLPILHDFFSVVVNGFATLADDDGDGTPETMLVPPEGVYGGSIGLQAGVALPTGLPVGGAVGAARYEPAQGAIRALYDRLRDTRFAGVLGRVNARLVDPHTGVACPESWPATDSARECVIELGERSWSHTRRATHTSYALCSFTGGCALPHSWPFATAALGLGAVQDAGGSFAAVCPSLGDAAHD